MRLKKYANNPILKPQGDGFEGLCVLNPAVIYDEDEKLFKMLYRAAGNDKQHYIYLGLAESKDGFNFERKFNKPVLAPDINGADGGCVEDPRLVKMGGYYYLTYASRTFAPGQYWREDKEYFGFRPEFGPTMLIYNNSVTHLAVSRDLINWKKLGRITDSRFDDRDVYIFPEKINGKFVRLSRPMEWCGKGFENEAPAIWISYSSDLMEWEKPRLLMKGNEWWENKKIGGSTPPIKCEYGYLVLYHGVAEKDGAYRVGAVILDKNDPEKILARTKDFIMEPEFDFETQGYYNGCVFPTGICVKDGEMFVYYGAADKFVCVATADFKKFCDSVYSEGKL
ncbi:MAG: glycosidase [Clostridia bacterium]|nr:glycosidase [Clostridia bacterium]